MRYTHRKSKKIIVCILIFLLSIVWTIPSFAVEKKETIKVGFVPIDGFFEYNKEGKEIGYGVNLLNKISIYSNFNFEYVKVDRSGEMYEALEDGKIDILMPVTDTALARDKYKFSRNSIIRTYNAIMTSKDRDDLYYDDEVTMSNIRIAAMKEHYEFDVNKENLFESGVSKNNFVFYSDYESCLKDLEADKVDAVLSNIMDLTDDLKLLQRFDEIDNHIISNKNFKYMEQIDTAIDNIKEDNPEFFSNIFKDYYHEKTIIPLTKEETIDLKKCKKLDFYFSKDSGSLSRLEKGEYVGFLPTLARDICESLGVEYNVISTDEEYFASKASIRTDFYYDQAWADKRDVTLSNPYLKFRYAVITREQGTTNDKVALVKGTKFAEEYIKDYLNNDKVVWYENYTQCLEAVKKGAVGTTIINNYIAEYYLRLYKYNNLSFRLVDFKHDVCFAIYGEDNENIVSAINKSLENFSEKDLQEMLVASAEDVSEESFWVLALYKYTGWTILIIVSILILFLIMLIMAIMAKKNAERNILLEQADKAKSEFLSQVSHDIRTPMNAIIGFSNSSITRDLGKTELLDNMDKINMSANHLSDLINNVLDMSKIENGKMQLNPSALNASEVIKHVEIVISPRALEKNIEFHFELIDVDDIYIMADKARMIELLINLISNAIKFTPEGGNVVCEIIKKDEMDDVVKTTIKVKDTGVGMSEDFQKNMFVPFTQEKNIGEGTGLGLAIVKNIVDLMGGTISVNSIAGEGSEFVVELDLAICPKDKLPSEETSDYSQSLKGKRILIVEDQHMNRLIVNKLLSKKGVIVEEVVNGLEAVKIISKEDVLYDAILMDIRMPVMGGIEATKTIRKLDSDYAKNIPIIAMTANAFEDDIQASKDAGMNRHLSKPVIVEDLYSTLTDLFSKTYNADSGKR